MDFVVSDSLKHMFEKQAFFYFIFLLLLLLFEGKSKPYYFYMLNITSDYDT